VGSWNSNPSSSLSTGISSGRLLMFLPQFPDHQNGYTKIKQNKKPQPNKKRVLWWLSGLRIQCCQFSGWGCCSGVGFTPGLGMPTYHTYAPPPPKKRYTLSCNCSEGKMRQYGLKGLKTVLVFSKLSVNMKCLSSPSKNSSQWSSCRGAVVNKSDWEL